MSRPASVGGEPRDYDLRLACSKTDTLYRGAAFGNCGKIPKWPLYGNFLNWCRPFRCAPRIESIFNIRDPLISMAEERY